MINLNLEVLNKLKKLEPNLNLSELIRDFLKRKVDFMNSGVAYDRHIIEKERDDLNKQYDSLGDELAELNKKLELLKDAEKKDDADRLALEDELATNKVTCIICKIPKTEEKLKDSKHGAVCHSCFMTCDPGTLNKYFGGKTDGKKDAKLHKFSKLNK